MTLLALCIMNKIPQETNGQFAEQNPTQRGSSPVLSQPSSLLVYSEAIHVPTPTHTHSHTGSCKTASSPLVYDLSSTAKKDRKEGIKLSFSEFFSVTELLYSTSFMVLCHVFFIPGEPCERSTPKRCRVLRDSQMLKLKVTSGRDCKLSSKTFSQGPTGMAGADHCPIYSHS